LTSSDESGASSVQRGDVTATSWGFPRQRLSACSPSSSSFQQEHYHQQSSDDDRQSAAYSTSYVNSYKHITNNDQSYQRNNLVTRTVPLPQGTVVNVVRKPIERAAQTW